VKRSVSGVGHRWFNRSTGKERSVTGDSDDDDDDDEDENNNNNNNNSNINKIPFIR
jgi:hypothetical protein